MGDDILEIDDIPEVDDLPEVGGAGDGEDPPQAEEQPQPEVPLRRVIQELAKFVCRVSLAVAFALCFAHSFYPCMVSEIIGVIQQALCLVVIVLSAIWYRRLLLWAVLLFFVVPAFIH